MGCRDMGSSADEIARWREEAAKKVADLAAEPKKKEEPQAPRRPHWLPEEVWMGVIIGQWPVRTFSCQDQAERWAAEGPWNPDRLAHEQRRIWRVEIPADTETFEVEKVPATTRIKPTRH